MIKRTLTRDTVPTFMRSMGIIGLRQTVQWLARMHVNHFHFYMPSNMENDSMPLTPLGRKDRLYLAESRDTCGTFVTTGAPGSQWVLHLSDLVVGPSLVVEQSYDPVLCLGIYLSLCKALILDSTKNITCAQWPGCKASWAATSLHSIICEEDAAKELAAGARTLEQHDVHIQEHRGYMIADRLGICWQDLWPRLMVLSILKNGEQISQIRAHWMIKTKLV